MSATQGKNLPTKDVFKSGDFTVSVSDGVAAIDFKDEDIYSRLAKEAGIDIKTIKEVSSFNAAYLDAAASAGTEKAIEVMKKDKKVETATVSLPYTLGKSGGVDLNIRREVTYPNPTNPDSPIKQSSVKVSITDPHSGKLPKSFVKGLSTSVTEALLK